MDAVVLVDPISSGVKLKDAAQDLKFKVIAVYTRSLTFYETEGALKEKDLRDKTDLVIFANDLEHVYRLLKEVPFKIKAALAGNDSGVELADQIAHAFNLPGNKIELSSARRDKGHMRDVQKKVGLTCPDFQTCETDKKVKDFAKKRRFPLVIKTPRGASTSHVYVCDDMESLVKHFHVILDSRNFFGDKTTSAVVEDYIGGEEYIVNTFSDGENIHVTDLWVYEKIDTETVKNIYYNIISIPFSHPKAKQMIQAGKEIAKNFGVLRGPAHIEVKDDPIRGFTLIELGARLAGASLPNFLQKYTNFDPYRASIEVFTKGETTVPDPVVFQKHCGIAYCPNFKAGTIKKISGIEEIEKLPSYERHHLRVHVGDVLLPTTYLQTTPLTAFFAHADRKQMLKDLEKAHKLFQMEVK